MHIHVMRYVVPRLSPARVRRTGANEPALSADGRSIEPKIYKLNALTIGNRTIPNGRLAVGDERAGRASFAAGTTRQPQVSVMQSHVTDANNSRTGTNARPVSAARRFFR